MKKKTRIPQRATEMPKNELYGLVCTLRQLPAPSVVEFAKQLSLIALPDIHEVGFDTDFSSSIYDESSILRSITAVIIQSMRIFVFVCTMVNYELADGLKK